MEQLPSTLNQTEADRGSFRGQVLCKDENDDKWIHLKSEKVCNKNVDCYNQKDERACFEKQMNRTEAIILNGVESDLCVKQAFSALRVNMYSSGLLSR